MIIWTDDRRDKAIKMWKAGVRTADIAVELGVTENAVKGFRNRNRKLFPDRKEPKKVSQLVLTIAEMWKTGMSLRLIAEELGKTEGQVAGLARRNRHLMPDRKTTKKIKVERPKRAKQETKFVQRGQGHHEPVLDEYELARLPGVSLMDNDGCMYALTEEGPHLFCGCTRQFGKRYCEYHVAKTTGYQGIDISYRTLYDKNIVRVEA